LIQPLTSDEFSQLETNIIEEGCRDPLVVWSKDSLLADGHHRLRICEHHDITYRTVTLNRESRAEVIDWIIANQLGRRNLSPEQMAYLLGERYNRTKQELGGGRYSKKTVGKNTPPKIRTSERLAKEYGVDEKTVRIDAEFAKAVNALAESFGEEYKKKILSREINIGKAKIIELVKLPIQNQKQVLSGEMSFEDAVRSIQDTRKTPSKTKFTIDNSSAVPWLKKQKPCDVLITAPDDKEDVEWLYVALEKTKTTGHAFVVIRNAPETLKRYLNAKTPTGWQITDIFAWMPTSGNAGDIYNDTWMPVLHYATKKSPELTYPSEKLAVYQSRNHEALIERLVRASTEKGNVVFDCFARAGLVLEIASRLGREALGCCKG
jgi:disulfide oxidoreductase YuzD